MPKTQYDPKIINPKCIENLESLSMPDEESILKQLVELYVVSAPVSLEAMKNSLNKDLKSIRQAAHTLKSSSAGLGASKVSKICGLIEYAPQDFRAEQFVVLLDELKVSLSEAITELSKLR